MVGRICHAASLSAYHRSVTFGPSNGAPVQASYVLCVLLAVPALLLFVVTAGLLGMIFASFVGVIGWMIYMSARHSKASRNSRSA